MNKEIKLPFVKVSTNSSRVPKDSLFLLRYRNHIMTKILVNPISSSKSVSPYHKKSTKYSFTSISSKPLKHKGQKDYNEKYQQNYRNSFKNNETSFQDEKIQLKYNNLMDYYKFH
jgi:hypothetical protein